MDNSPDETDEYFKKYFEAGDFVARIEQALNQYLEQQSAPLRNVLLNIKTQIVNGNDASSLIIQAKMMKVK